MYFVRENILIPILTFVRKYSIIQIDNMNIFSYIQSFKLAFNYWFKSHENVFSLCSYYTRIFSFCQYFFRDFFLVFERGLL